MDDFESTDNRNTLTVEKQLLAEWRVEYKILANCIAALEERIERDKVYGSHSRGKLPMRILSLLAANPEITYSHYALQVAFPTVHEKTIRSAISRLYQQKKVARPRRGRYQSLPGQGIF